MIDLNSKIDMLELTVRSNNVLKAQGIFIVKDLIQRTERDCLRMENMGRKSLNEIKEHLAVHGLVLGSIFEEPEKKINLNIGLRDWFAGQALVGLLANPETIPDSNIITTASYRIADEIMKARKK